MAPGLPGTPGTREQEPVQWGNSVRDATMVYQVSIKWICYSYRLHLESCAFWFLFCSSHASFQCPFGYLGEVKFFWLAAGCGFFGIWEYLRLIYILNSHQALKLQWPRHITVTLPILGQFEQTRDVTACTTVTLPCPCQLWLTCLKILDRSATITTLPGVLPEPCEPCQNLATLPEHCNFNHGNSRAPFWQQ